MEEGKDSAPAAAAAADGPASSAPPQEEDEEALLARAQSVVSRVLESELDPNPNPRLLHTLATMCELQEARFVTAAAAAAAAAASLT
jgi:HIV-1 Vpr-binding protein